ncbi:MAG: holo-ACP synthase [Anaerolineae bacterium]|nr:holo-ACP synthase [Anaerolineae bacterium]
MSDGERTTPVPPSVGVDLVEIPRIARAIERWGDRMLKRVYTPAELALCRGRVPELAARFAAKEAVSKALGVGIWWRGGIGWKDAEVLSDPIGKPEVFLYGRAADRARELGLDQWAISLSHTQEQAIAVVVATRNGRFSL